MRLFVFGLGYSAMAFVRSGGPWSRVAGTVRQPDKAGRLGRDGIAAYPAGAWSGAAMAEDIRGADAVLVSAPPGEDGDPFLTAFGGVVAGAPNVAWVGYLSTTGIYGDRGGAWVDEATPPAPQNLRSEQRLAAEQGWLDLGRRTGVPVQVFRLTGIYGPGRNALVNLARGTARRIVKPGQVFSRIHVDDIAAVLSASLDRPRPGAVYNVGDDEPAAPQDVVAYAASLAGVPPPPEIPFDEADLGPMARSFYAESRRVANRLIRQELGVRLGYPTYRDGLRALYAAGEFDQAR